MPEQQPSLRIAVLGAESTGKTALAQALAARLATPARPVHVVGEYLREWCVREGRTPRPDEQRAIADEQARRADAASAPVVIADTTPLMTAVYSELLFGDRSLYAFALAHQQRYDLTLVTGLDLPWVPDGLQRDGPQVRAPVDALVRTALASAGIGFRVVYGSGEQRVLNALAAIEAQAAPPVPRTSRPWTWVCDKCSDPACEHRLFTARLNS